MRAPMAFARPPPASSPGRGWPGSCTHARPACAPSRPGGRRGRWSSRGRCACCREGPARGGDEGGEGGGGGRRGAFGGGALLPLPPPGAGQAGMGRIRRHQVGLARGGGGGCGWGGGRRTFEERAAPQTTMSAPRGRARAAGGWPPDRGPAVCRPRPCDPCARLRQVGAPGRRAGPAPPLHPHPGAAGAAHALTLKYLTIQSSANWPACSADSPASLPWRPLGSGSRAAPGSLAEVMMHASVHRRAPQPLRGGLVVDAVGRAGVDGRPLVNSNGKQVC